MKIQIRKSVFETNSSSTHALCLAKNYDKENIPKIINFGIMTNEEQWTAEQNMQYRIDILFASIIGKNDYYTSRSFIRLGKLINLLTAANIIYKFNFDEDYIENNLLYIEYTDWVDIVLENEEMFLRFLTNNDSNIIEIDNDELYRRGGFENIIDKNKCDIYE